MKKVSSSIVLLFLFIQFSAFSKIDRTYSYSNYKNGEQFEKLLKHQTSSIQKLKKLPSVKKIRRIKKRKSRGLKPSPFALATVEEEIIKFFQKKDVLYTCFYFNATTHFSIAERGPPTSLF